MSKVKDNIVTTGLSGKLGKQIVFRQWEGATFLAKAPRESKNKVITPQMQRFKEAIIYAKKVMDDPELMQIYKSKCKARQTAYNMAVREFLTSPEIGSV